MARIADQAVYFRSRGALDVEWDIQGLLNPAPTVDIHRSESPSGPWQELVAGLDESLHAYRDHFVGTSSLSNRLYYRITVHDGGDTLVGDPFYLGNKASPTASRTFTLNNMYMRRAGYPCAFFVLRRLGDPCPDCGADNFGTPANPRCSTCYGTGKSGGYYSPVLNMVCIEGPDQNRKMSTSGEMAEKLVRRFWTTNTPTLEGGDLMQDAENTMWKITGDVIATRCQGHITRQMFAAAPLTREDVTYDLLTDLGVEFFTEEYYHGWRDSSGDLVTANPKGNG